MCQKWLVTDQRIKHKQFTDQQQIYGMTSAYLFKYKCGKYKIQNGESS